MNSSRKDFRNNHLRWHLCLCSEFTSIKEYCVLVVSNVVIIITDIIIITWDIY